MTNLDNYPTHFFAGKPLPFFIGENTIGSTIGNSSGFTIIPFVYETYSALVYPNIFDTTGNEFKCPFHGFFTISYTLHIENLSSADSAEIMISYGDMTSQVNLKQIFAGSGASVITTIGNTVPVFCKKNHIISVSGLTSSLVDLTTATDYVSGLTIQMIS